ncbi:MAG: hypothetical protein ACK4UL_00640, partial [Novosphingobium meiothermophilum]
MDASASIMDPASGSGPATDTGAVPQVPYGYARDRGVLVERMDENGLDVALREGGDRLALIELRRAHRRPLAVREVPQAEFEKLLASTFAVDGAAAAVAGDMGRAG